MRDKNRVVTDEANIGVKKVISDQHNTAKVKTFFPPKRFEQLPPMILIKRDSKYEKMSKRVKNHKKLFLT
jgi:hypothetical protein